MRILFSLTILPFLFFNSTVNAKEPEKQEQKQFTFSWQFIDSDTMKPRGGTTKGKKIDLSPRSYKDWRNDRDSKESKYEKDLVAIMSLTGMYRVSFDFLETIVFENDTKPDVPYQSWGTEYIFPIEVKENFVSLQHILVMEFQSDEMKPYVMKHWREDWTYEDQSMLVYTDSKNWKNRSLNKKLSRGKWTQAVFQVDDSPRYEGYGKWSHNKTYSAWMSNSTLRPLPRREFSVRDDYDILKGHNRVTITPQGWVHEEDNLKVKVSGSHSEKIHTFKAREIGVARYEKIKNFRTSPALKYWESTKLFWADVRNEWQSIVESAEEIEIKSSYNDEKLFAIMFAYAAELENGKQYNQSDSKKFVAETLKNLVK